MTQFPAVIDLSTLDGSEGANPGFRLDGIDPTDRSGNSVASAGDINGDGFADVVIGAWGASSLTGESYVVFGAASGFAASLDLSALDGSNGFRLDGIDGNDRAGFSVASAGDVNGDGFDDVIVSAHQANSNTGESYVVFGKASGFAASFDLSTLDGSNGFRLDGIDSGDLSGTSVASAGDVNGDGFADLIIGASFADGQAGETYVVLGRAPDEAVTRTGAGGDQTILGGEFDDAFVRRRW